MTTEKNEQISGILIDPYSQTVGRVYLSKGNTLQGIYHHLQCQLVEAPFSTDDGDTFYVDEEGWLHESEGEQLAGFALAGWHSPLLGRCLILGTDEEGESVSPKIDSPEYWHDRLIFVPHEVMLKYGEAIGLR